MRHIDPEVEELKKIALFVRDRENPSAIQYLQNSLYRVLDKYVEITIYYLNEMDPAQQVESDAYLVLYEEMLANLVRHIKDFSKVIVITRNFQKKLLEQVLEIPEGSNVLVINDSKASTLQTIYMIYELGSSS